MAEMLKATKSNTTMAAAFAAAGFETMSDKLRRLMASAITADGPGRGLSDPSLRRFKALVLGEDDPALVWFLFDEVGSPLMLFYEVLADVRAGKEFGGGDHEAPVTQRNCEPSSDGGTAAETNFPLQPKASLSRAAVPATTTKRAQHAPPGHGVSGMQVILHWGQQSWLRRFTVGNKPVAAMTLRELEDAIAARGRDYRFLMLLRDSWPAYTNGGTVSDYVSDEDGDRLYEKAKEPTDV